MESVLTFHDDNFCKCNALHACASDACALEIRRQFVTKRGEKKKKKRSRNLNPGPTFWVINIDRNKPSRKHCLHVRSGKQVSSMSARIHKTLNIHVAWLSTLFGRPSEQWTRWLRCGTRHRWSANSRQFSQFNSIHKVETLSKMSCLLFISWIRKRCFEHYTVYTSYSLPESQNLSKLVQAVTWTMKRNPGQTSRWPATGIPRN